MRRSYGVVVALCAMVTLAGGLISAGISAGEEKKSIRVIYSNDLLGYTVPCG